VPFTVGDLVYVSTKNITFEKGLARKLIPRYLGPYLVVHDFKNQSFQIAISPNLKQRGVHDVFHASLLRLHVPNDDRLFPGRADSQLAATSDEPEPEWAVERLVSHARAGKDALFEVLWKAGDRTWLPYREIATLPALEQYLEALGVDNISNLPHGSGRPPLDDPQVVLE
jgi:hypothetical protein